VIALGCGDDSTATSIDAPRSPDAPRSDGPLIDGPAIDAPIDAPAADAPMVDAAIDGPMPDAACVPSGAEDCFNGIDDDCNGLTDCEDPACNAIAECVPNAPNVAFGVHVPTGTACPAGYTGGGPVLAQGLQSSGSCSGCTCTGFTVCGSVVRELAAGTCPGTEITNRIVWSNQCISLPFTTTNVHVDALQLQSTCGAAGTPMVPPASWTTETQFCRGGAGLGCSPGSVCVHKATQHCVLHDGTTSCAAGYSPESGGTWYTSVTDNRSCGASCSCGSTGGSCGTSFVRAFAGGSNCSSSTTIDLTSNADNCALSFTPASGRIILQGDTPPTCFQDNILTGTATPSGAETLCCL
jgi:hypothetical protein